MTFGLEAKGPLRRSPEAGFFGYPSYTTRLGTNPQRGEGLISLTNPSKESKFEL